MRKTFNSKAIIEKLKFYFDIGQNVLLTGEKGVGKSTIISEVFNSKSTKWLYFSASTIDPYVDFVGVPKEKEREDGTSFLEFIRPDYMSDDVEAIFLDEFNRAPKKIKNAVMELIQFKSINGKKFPKLKVVWAGINPYDPDAEELDAYDVEPIDPAQQDRFQIQIEIPYLPDDEYFLTKYAQEWVDGAMEWWHELPEKIKKMVSPRRLDYALSVHLMGGDISDVLPKQSNPSKLALSIKTGGILNVLENFLKKGDSVAAKNFLNSENNYQSCRGFIFADEAKAAFFTPLINDERLMVEVFSNKKFYNVVTENPIQYKSLLESISRADTAPAEIQQKVTRIVKKMSGVSIDDIDVGAFNAQYDLGNIFATASGIINNPNIGTASITGYMPSKADSNIGK
jgi:hypothetical protein